MDFVQVKIKNVKIKNNYILLDVYNEMEQYKDVVFFTPLGTVYIPKQNESLLLYRTFDSCDQEFMFCMQLFAQQNTSNLSEGEFEVKNTNNIIQFLLGKLNIFGKKLNLKGNNINILKNISDERQQDKTRVEQLILVLNAIKDIPELISAKPTIESAVASITESKATSDELKTSLDSSFDS